MSTIGIDCRFEPEKPLEYSPAKLDKLINAALNAKPAYKTTYAWDWPLQNIEFDLLFDGTVKSLPMEGLLVNDILHWTYFSTAREWKGAIARFLSGEVKRLKDYRKSLRVKQYLEAADLPKVALKNNRAANINVFIEPVENQPSAVRMSLGFSGLKSSDLKPSDWAKQVVTNLNPNWQLVPSDPKKMDMYFEIREGPAAIGKWGTSGDLKINLSSNSMEKIVDLIDQWKKVVEAPDTSPLVCEIRMDNYERQKDQAAEYAIGLKQAPEGYATWMQTQYAVMSHEGLASLKQWPARSDGKELESSVCYFERNRRERAAISVATGPKGQYIFFTSVQSTMQAELENLFGLKLVRVKKAKR